MSTPSLRMHGGGALPAAWVGDAVRFSSCSDWLFDLAQWILANDLRGSRCFKYLWPKEQGIDRKQAPSGSEINTHQALNAGGFFARQVNLGRLSATPTGKCLYQNSHVIKNYESLCSIFLKFKFYLLHIIIQGKIIVKCVTALSILQ